MPYSVWVYTFSVTDTSEWPIRYCRLFTSMPALAMLVQKVWRSTWGVTLGNEVQAEIEGIPPDDLIREGHLEGGADHAPDGGDGVPGIAVIKKLDEPFLGVGHLHVADDLFAEIVLAQDTLNELVTRTGGVADVALLVHIALHQFVDGDVALAQVDAHGGAD